MALKIHLGLLDEALKNPGKSFNHLYETSWFDDAFIQDMILDVDKCKYMGNDIFYHPVLENIMCTELSTGVKNLILGYKLDRIIDASYCGDNCVKWLIEIGKLKDLNICLSHTMTVPEDFTALMVNTNETVKCAQDYYNYNFFNLRCYHLGKEYTTLERINEAFYSQSNSCEEHCQQSNSNKETREFH